MEDMKQIYIKPHIHSIEMGKVFLAAESRMEDGKADSGLTKGTDMCTWEDEEDEPDDGECREYEGQWNYQP